MAKRNLMDRFTGFGVVLALFLLPLLSGCIAMASEEDLQMLEEARNNARAAEADLDACRQKRAELERTLAEKKQELQRATADRDAVQNALNQ
jgi:septal ring factor EnvC (AmiA/AmiB activator)